MYVPHPHIVDGWVDTISASCPSITAYYDSDNVIVTNPSKIALRYLKSWFFIDFFSSFPYDEVG